MKETSPRSRRQSVRSPRRPRLLYLCDWLPPDFGAVGQYSLLFARQRASRGEDVVLAGLASKESCDRSEEVGRGVLRTVRLHASDYDRSNFARRALWTLRTNFRLLWRLRRELVWTDEVLFTGSPPFLIHYLVPLNWLLRKRLVYRITDFHPECLLAGMKSPPLALRAFHRLTVFLRRRVDSFEVLGEDQRRRLADIGISKERIVLKRDPAPVAIGADTTAMKPPAELSNVAILLYSGNFGVAHDEETFLQGYRRHHLSGSGSVGLWLNAVGSGADRVESRLRSWRLPVHRSRPLPLEELPRLLITPQAHLITLRDSYVGFVLPSKVHGCILSGQGVLFVGSCRSDVHSLCSEGVGSDRYWRAEVGDFAAVAKALEEVGHLAMTSSSPG